MVVALPSYFLLIRRLPLDAGYEVSGDHNGSITSSVCEQTSQRSEMRCRQETVAEGDRVTSTGELHCAAFDAHLIGVDPD